MTYEAFINDLASWVSGIGSLIATIALMFMTYFISKRQIELTEQELKISLYDKRLIVYRKLENIIISVLDRDDAIRTNALSDLFFIKDEVSFLFKSDIHKYVLEIINNIEHTNLYFYDREKDTEYYELSEWLMNQVKGKKEMREVFKTYLDLGCYGLLNE